MRWRLHWLRVASRDAGLPLRENLIILAQTYTKKRRKIPKDTGSNYIWALHMYLHDIESVIVVPQTDAQVYCTNTQRETDNFSKSSSQKATLCTTARNNNQPNLPACIA